MINVVKYGAIAGLAILGTLATGGSATTAVLAGGLAIASKGVEQICETVQNNDATEQKGKIANILTNAQQKTKDSPIKESRDRARQGRPPIRPRDKRIAGR